MRGSTPITPDPLRLLSFNAMVRMLGIGKDGEPAAFARRLWERVPKVMQNADAGRAKTMWSWVEVTLLEMAEENRTKECAAMPVAAPCVPLTRPAWQAAPQMEPIADLMQRLRGKAMR